MSLAMAPRNRWAAPVAALVLALGLLVTTAPFIALGLAAAALVVALTFAAPVANLVLIILTTAVVPYSVQNQLTGGAGARGLIVSDLLLLAGLLRVVPGLVAGRGVERRHRLLLAPLAAFLVVVVYQFARGVMVGNDLSTAGAEFRTLLGFSTFLVAVPVVSDARARRQLAKGLLVTGLLLGLWGIAQWLFDIRFKGEFGVREGISFTTSGRGQLQGGLYAFPVAAVLGFAAIVSGEFRQLRHRLMVIAVTALNLLCVVLTYERTFWVATVVAMGVVTVKAGHGPRSRALVWGPAMILVLLAGMATFAPGALGSARERLLSLGQYSTDASLYYRIVESRHVGDEIRARSGLGSGLGAEIVWSRPWDGVPARSYDYTHNGYLWAAWKLGVPAAVLLCATLLTGVAWRVPDRDPLRRSMRHGSQAALLLLMIANLTFPSFNTYGITATMGLLLAFSATAASTRQGNADEVEPSAAAVG